MSDSFLSVRPSDVDALIKERHRLTRALSIADNEVQRLRKALERIRDWKKPPHSHDNFEPHFVDHRRGVMQFIERDFLPDLIRIATDTLTPPQHAHTEPQAHVHEIETITPPDGEGGENE